MGIVIAPFEIGNRSESNILDLLAYTLTEEIDQ